MIFYSVHTRTPLRYRCHATTDAESDVLRTMNNPHGPSVFVPDCYAADIPPELLLSSELETNLCVDLCNLNRVRFQRNFTADHYGGLVDRVRFRAPMVQNALLAHTARQSLRSCTLNFFPDLGLLRHHLRGDAPLDHDPETGECL